MTRIRITLLSTKRWPENEYEGSAFFEYQGREIEARVILSGEKEWTAWTVGRVVDADIYLQRVGPVRKESQAPGLTRVGRALYEAAGRVVRKEDDERVVMDVGFPLLVDLDPAPRSVDAMPEVGEAIFLAGEMQIEPVD